MFACRKLIIRNLQTLEILTFDIEKMKGFSPVILYNSK